MKLILISITALCLSSCKGYIKEYALEYQGIKVAVKYTPSGKEVVSYK